MKKLGKLTISPEKIMKNEDLINLQGGYEGGPYQVMCACHDVENDIYWGTFICATNNCWDCAWEMEKTHGSLFVCVPG